MITKDVHYDRMRADIVKQLEELGIKSNEHDTLRELQRKLAVALVALDVEVKSPHAGWF